MRARQWIRWVVCAAGSLVVLPAGAAVTTFVNDPFTDGDLTAGSDNSGVSWTRRSANQAISIQNDSAGIGTGNALQLSITGSNQVDRAALGLMSTPLTLATAGDTITLSFDFRFVTAPTVSAADGFRFGLSNTNGTSNNADGGAASDNDFGYQASIGTATTQGGSLRKETADGTAGGAGSGGDRAVLTATNPGTVAIADTLKHSAVLTLTRTATGVTIDASVDGTSLGSATDTTSPFFTFDEILFNHATPQAFRVDNVLVTSNVPEPGAVGLLAVGAVGAGVGRRRRSPK